MNPDCSSSIILCSPVFSLFAKMSANILASLFNKLVGLQLSRYNLFLLGFGISVITPCFIVHQIQLILETQQAERELALSWMFYKTPVNPSFPAICYLQGFLYNQLFQASVNHHHISPWIQCPLSWHCAVISLRNVLFLALYWLLSVVFDRTG